MGRTFAGIITATTGCMLLLMLAACSGTGTTSPTSTPIIIVVTATPQPAPTGIPNTEPPALPPTDTAIPPTNTLVPPPPPTNSPVPPPPTSTQPAAEKTITLKGSGISKTKSFHLNSGNYTISWTAADNTGQYSVGCYYGGFLQAVDPSVFFMETVGNEMVKAGGTANGSTEVYNVKPGEYYLNMSSGCSWTVTIAPEH